MTHLQIDGARIYYELSGDGDLPLALVHGGCLSHLSWNRLVPRLERSLRVLTYDRRGHSASEGRRGPDAAARDAADLAALMEQLDLAPAWLGGVSAGAAVALRTAVERPELARGLVLHEPALFSLLAGDPEGEALLGELSSRLRAVVDRVDEGDSHGAARQFMESVADGPGTWERLAPDYRQVIVENIHTLREAVGDPDAFAIDLDRLAALELPVLLTQGENSPPAFRPVLDRLAQRIPLAEVRTVTGAKHIPHRTHPELYAEMVTAFVGDRSA